MAWYSGYWARRGIKRDNAARFIQKALKRIKYRKFQDAVMAVIAIKRLVRFKNTAAISVQRYMRGHITRVKVVRYLQYLMKRNKKAGRLVTRALKRYRDIMYRIRNPPVRVLMLMHEMMY